MRTPAVEAHERLANRLVIAALRGVVIGLTALGVFFVVHTI